MSAEVKVVFSAEFLHRCALAALPEIIRAHPGYAAKTAAVEAPSLVGNRSGQIPAGDVRLTANIRGDLHLKLKIRAAEQRTTVGELIEQWIESWR